MAQQLGTVIFALRRHPVDVVGKTVVILGQGSAGAFFTYLLRRAGAGQIIVSDLSAARLAFSRQLGADVALNPTEDDVRQAVRDATGGAGADYLVEAVGSKETLLQTVDLVRPDAEMLWFGLPDTRKPVPIDFSRFFGKRLTAYSIFGAQDEPGLVSFRRAADLIARRDIDVAPLLSHVLSIEQVDEAMAIAHDRRDNALKVSLSF
jgi:L-iditol 2-dehydrogenase